MLKQIEIEDFQNLRYASIDLDPGINIFIGESDQGKSAIVKGLYWLFFNRPSGDAFVRDISSNKKASRCSFSTTLSNGTEITRYKERNENAYLINQKKKKALRSDVPEEARSALNISETNIQTQFTPFFLLSLSPGQRAKLLNSAVGLDEIDRSLSSVNSLQRAAKREKERLESVVEAKEEELASYDWVDEAIKDIDRLFKLGFKYDQMAEERDLLEHLISRIDQTNLWFDTDIKPILDAEEEIKDFVHKTYKAQQLSSDYSYLNGRTKALETLEGSLDALKEMLEAEDEVDELYVSVSRFKKLRGEAEALRKLTDRIKQLNRMVGEAQMERKEAEEKYNNLMDGYEKCPLCGSQLNEN